MSILGNLELSEPVFLRNLRIHPIQSPATDGIKISAISEILQQQSGSFRELDPPDINRIAFDNEGNHPVLMLDGEEIVGAMQNRIIADSILVKAQSTTDIPVICAEEGRWNAIGEFRTGYCSYPSIRAILSRRGKRENTLQKRVWKEIERKLTATKTLSTTSSMHDIYNNLEDEVTRYVEGFESLNHDTIGFIGVTGNKILGCDLFLDHATYRKFEERLIRSYALDAIEHRKSSSGEVDATGFLENIKHSFNKKKTSDKQHHFSLKEKRYSGQGFIHDGRIIHLSVFPK
ncbi:MAG: hypothetical protein JSU64_08960 [candidate division WOR-3 bacterium]|nr:MAG: hypothetical protein JSU64_08960 [candidate division WOR-3 bacterium]